MMAVLGSFCQAMNTLVNLKPGQEHYDRITDHFDINGLLFKVTFSSNKQTHPMGLSAYVYRAHSYWSTRRQFL